MFPFIWVWGSLPFRHGGNHMACLRLRFQRVSVICITSSISNSFSLIANQRSNTIIFSSNSSSVLSRMCYLTYFDTCNWLPPLYSRVNVLVLYVKDQFIIRDCFPGFSIRTNQCVNIIQFCHLWFSSIVINNMYFFDSFIFHIQIFTISRSFYSLIRAWKTWTIFISN